MCTNYILWNVAGVLREERIVCRAHGLREKKGGR